MGVTNDVMTLIFNILDLTLILHFFISDIDECRLYSNRGQICAGKCINLPGSYRCSCPDGWRSLANGRSCQGILSVKLTEVTFVTSKKKNTMMSIELTFIRIHIGYNLIKIRPLICSSLLICHEMRVLRNPYYGSHTSDLMSWIYNDMINSQSDYL